MQSVGQTLHRTQHPFFSKKFNLKKITTFFSPIFSNFHSQPKKILTTKPLQNLNFKYNLIWLCIFCKEYGMSVTEGQTFCDLHQGITINGDGKIQTLGTPKAVQQVNTSHLAKKLASQLEKKPKPFRARFEYNMGNNFFYFGKYRPKRSNFFRILNIQSKIEYERIFLIKYYTISSKKNSSLLVHKVHKQKFVIDYNVICIRL